MEILDVDLLAFERGDRAARQGVVDGVMKSLVTGFVYVEHDMSIDMIDEVYGNTRRVLLVAARPQGCVHSAW